MKRFSVLAISALLLLAPAVSGAMASGASTQPSPSAAPVGGDYKLFYDWNQTGFSHSIITLNHDGTGSDRAGHEITWSISAKVFTLHLSVPGSVVATYVGHKSPGGFCSRRHRCTMSNTIGDSGYWYAAPVV